MAEGAQTIAATTPRCHVTVDVDPLRCYAEIHGLDPALASNAVYERGMLRFLDAFERHGVRATFFVVTADLEDPATGTINRGIIREAAERGHEIASHTHTHPYRFDRLDAAAQEREIARSVQVIREVTGHAPTGFRAPGYNIRPELVPLLARHGIRYDASILPSRFYYLLRAAMIAKIRLTGKRSGSQLGRWRNFASGSEPRILAHGGAVLRELPITVLPGIGFPMVGTFWNLLGRERAEALLGLAAEARPLHIEFHGVDLMELERDQLPAAFAVQGDLTIPLARKQAAIERLLGFVRGRFAAVPLAEAPHGR
jgi:hypothetical protein